MNTMRRLYIIVGICILTSGIGYGQNESPGSKLSGNWWITYTEPDEGTTTWYMTIAADYTAVACGQEYDGDAQRDG
jgi:hypothetical protein